MSKNSNLTKAQEEFVVSAPALLKQEISHLLSMDYKSDRKYRIERNLRASCGHGDKDEQVTNSLLKPFFGFKKRFENVEDYTKCIGNSDMLASLVAGKIRIVGEVFKHHKSDQSQDEDVVNRRGKELLFMAFPGYDGKLCLANQSDLVKSDILAASKAYSVIEKLCEISCEKNRLAPQSSPVNLNGRQVAKNSGLGGNLLI